MTNQIANLFDIGVLLLVVLYLIGLLLEFGTGLNIRQRLGLNMDKRSLSEQNVWRKAVYAR